VLLVEDDEKFGVVLSRALERVGLDTATASTGDAALNAMRTLPEVSAVVLDVMIPHPDGIEVCRQLRRDGWRGPIVAISARTSSTDRARVNDAGADAFLPKPFRLTDLCETVASLLGGAQTV
jgi:DNA-binding response OmpR family regulator